MTACSLPVPGCVNRAHGEERIGDFVYCNLWRPYLTREESMAWAPPRRLWPDRWPCSSPRRNQCRAGTKGLGRHIETARWSCTGGTGHEAFQGPLAHDPFSSAPWRFRVPVTGGKWNWFDADLEGKTPPADD